MIVFTRHARHIDLDPQACQVCRHIACTAQDGSQAFYTRDGNRGLRGYAAHLPIGVAIEHNITNHGNAQMRDFFGQ